MVQDNSLLEQSRHSEQVSLQNLQLAELRKIANQLSSGGYGGVGSNPGTVGSQYTGTVGVQPTNMTALPDNGNLHDGFNMFTQAAAVGGLALKSGINGINNASSISRNALDRTVGYIERMQQSPFFAYKSIDWTRTNMEQAEYIQLQSRHRVENAGIKFGTAVGTMGTASLGGLLGTTFGGAIGGIAGTIVGNAVGAIGGDQIIKHVGVQQGYEKWLQQNSGRMINMFESNDGFGDGFNKREEKSLSKMLSKMNTQFFMSDDEMFTMLNNVTDAGLMKSTSDMEDFAKRFSGLVESVKSGAKMLNASYEEMTQLYGEWNKMGIKTDAERAEMTSQIKTLSMVTGASESASAGNLAALISNLTSGNTLDSAKASDIAQSDLALASIAREKNQWSEDSARLVENRFGSDDAKVAAAMASSLKTGYGDQTIKQATVAAMKLDENGKVVVDQQQLNSIISSLRSGEKSIDEVLDESGRKLESGELGVNFAHQWQNITGDKLYQMMIEGGGNAGTNQFLSTMLQKLADRDPRLDVNSLMVDMNIASDIDSAKMAKEWMDFKSGGLGSAVDSEVQRQNSANIIRNEASSEFGVSLGTRIKNRWEGFWQGAASLIPSLDGGFDSFKDFLSDTDTAHRNGYSNAKKVSIASGDYKDVFKDIEASSEKLDKEFKTNIREDLNSSKGLSKIASKFDTFTDVLFSPTKWDTFLSGTDMVSTSLSNRGESIKDIRKKTNKSKTMSDSEKEEMLSNLSQATGQTQDMVSGALDVVTALGGRDAREKMLDSISVDTATKVKTGAKSFDDFTNEKVLNRMSLSDQKRIQELAVNQAVKQIEKQFGNNLDGLGDLVKNKGLADGNAEIQSILEDGVSKSEVRRLVKELMTVSQGGSGESDLNQLLGESTKNAADNTKQANKNMDKANKNMEDMSDKIDSFSDLVNKVVKELDKRINQLETTMSRF